MNRFHVHVAVDDLEANIRFYSALFGTEPRVRKDDYAKWMIEDPPHQFRDLQARPATGREPSGHPGGR